MDVFKGDQYVIHCIITIGEGDDEHSITPEEIEDMELILGKKSKTYLNGEVTFDNEHEEWLYNFTQEESFCFGQNEQMQARVKIMGAIYGVNLGTINVANMTTRRIL